MNPWDPVGLPENLKLPASQPSSQSISTGLLHAMMGPSQPTATSPAEKSPVAKLEDYIIQGAKVLEKKPFDKHAGVQWLRRVRASIAAIFGSHSEICKALHQEIQKVVNSGASIEQVARKLGELKPIVHHLNAISLVERPTSTTSFTPSTKNVFIIHGHDELNTRRLERLLQTNFGLNPIAMLARPGMSRPLTDKFEDEAGTCSFAFALFTPDDEVTNKGNTYGQARPNVIYEVGWFIGRLGKKRVALLLKQGTEIHSDLHGVSRIHFAENIEDKFLQIQQELQAAELVT